MELVLDLHGAFTGSQLGVGSVCLPTALLLADKDLPVLFGVDVCKCQGHGGSGGCTVC